MGFLVVAEDKPDSGELRQRNREAHLAYIEGVRDKIVAGGPILSEDGRMIGSAMMLDFDTREELDAFLAGDPYARAGLFGTVTVHPWKKVLPA